MLNERLQDVVPFLKCELVVVGTRPCCTPLSNSAKTCSVTRPLLPQNSVSKGTTRAKAKLESTVLLIRITWLLSSLALPWQPPLQRSAPPLIPPQA